MAFGFDDKHATSLLSPQLGPGERVLFRTRGVEKHPLAGAELGDRKSTRLNSSHRL